MTNYLLGRVHSSIYEETTPFRLARRIGIEHINTLRNISVKRNDNLVRYGLSIGSELDSHFNIIINRAEAIRRSNNKYVSSLLLRNNDIPSPKIFGRWQLKEKDLPVLRRLKNHSRGTDIVLIEKLSDIVAGDFYTEFLDGENEYRVHVFGRKVIRIQLKTSDNEDDSFIKNVNHGYYFVDHFEHNISLEKKICEISIRAVDTIGLDFGAVDILVTKEKKPYVLEVNSAPRLNKFGRQLYSVYIARLLGIDIPSKKLSRIRLNEGSLDNGLDIEFRDIVKKSKE